MGSNRHQKDGPMVYISEFDREPPDLRDFWQAADDMRRALQTMKLRAGLIRSYAGLDGSPLENSIATSALAIERAIVTAEDSMVAIEATLTAPWE